MTSKKKGMGANGNPFLVNGLNHPQGGGGEKNPGAEGLPANPVSEELCAKFVSAYRRLEENYNQSQKECSMLRLLLLKKEQEMDLLKRTIKEKFAIEDDYQGKGLEE